MYPNLYYAFKDLFGVDWKFLRFINSFGFFVAIAFVGAAIILTKELRRKESEGLLQAKEETIVVGKPASFAELLTNFILGFLLGYKIIGLFLSDSPLAANPQDFIFSSAGNWPAGLLLGLLFAGVKWWEKNKQKLPQPEERKIRIWPHDRVGDLTIFAAVFGFAGAKVFNSLETWNEFIKNPIESLISFSGLTFYGGLICAALAIWYYAKKRNIGFWQLNDSAAPGLMMAYAIGRIGCQVSGDGDWGIINSAYYTNLNQKVVLAPRPDYYNVIVTKNSDIYVSQFGSLNVPHAYAKAPSFLPDWLFAYPYPHNVINEGIRIPNCTDQYCSYLPLPVFPTPVYETLICLGLFFIIWTMRKKFTVPGTLFALYLVLNGIERFFIEKIRVNTKYTKLPFQPTQAEIISFLLVFTGVGLYFFLRNQNKKTKSSA
ncbi:MAG TPA: prolipoprotein diacylglyceryl transferase family protein [Puia sp.]|nr:prolipoprotein diacylglyceryl transferase family protein [Puia sp.]